MLSSRAEHSGKNTNFGSLTNGDNLRLTNQTGRDAALPAQHGVGLRCEDGWIDDEASVVHYQRDSLRAPHAAAAHGRSGSGLLGVLVNKHHLSDSEALEGALGAGQAAGAAAHHAAAAGAAGGDPLRSGTAGPGRRAAISLTVCTAG